MAKYVWGGKRILIVDDERINHVLISSFLKPTKIQITCVSSGIEALSLLETEQFDIILLDYRMPNMSGLEFVCNVRNLDVNIPIILESGYSLNLTENEMKRKGIAAILEKPFTKATIIETVAEFI